MASYSDGLYAMRARDGEVLWNRPMESVTSIAWADGRVLAASSDGYFWGVDAVTGAIQYRTKLLPTSMSRIVVRGPVAVFTAGETGLLVVDHSTGKPLQAKAFVGRLESSAGWNGRDLAVVSSTGILYALREGVP